MKKNNHLLLLLFIPALVLTGCKYDDGDLWSKVNDHEKRLAALEQWQTAVNGNIATLQSLVTALQNNDYVTGVTLFDTPAPGGCRISFDKSEDAVVWNGAKGNTGETGTAPVIGVAEYPQGSGIYYWTLDGAFIESSGKKMPVTGAAPQLRIDGTTNYWEVSYDGSGWTSLNVKATGDTGDAIFAKDGIDDSNDDYVVFMLADGVTTITLPKYSDMVFMIGISETLQINAGATRTFSVTAVNVADIVVAKPDGWRVSVNKDMTVLTVSAPEPANIYAETGGVISVLAFNPRGRVMTVSTEAAIVDHVVFGDPEFKAEMLAKYPELFGADGEIPFSVAAQVTNISIYKAWNEPKGNITSLEGIEAFTGLKTLMCGYHNIGFMDLSKNTLLETLSCSNNNLAEIDLSNNPELNYLACGHNPVTTLDTSGNPKLTVIDCAGYYLTSINVAGNPELTRLYCGTHSNLTSLNLANNSKLITLSCSDCGINSLDLSNNPGLTELRCANNKLEWLDISVCVKLAETSSTVYCENQRIDAGDKTGIKVWSDFDPDSTPAGWSYSSDKVQWVW